MTPVEKEAQALIDAGWYQTSRRWRMIARLPEGKTGIEALIEARLKHITVRRDYWISETKRWANMLGEESSAEQFRRCYAHETPGLHRTLDKETFDAFRRLGGTAT